MSLRIPRPANSFPNRILVLKILAHHCFICDAHKRCVLSEILRSKVASGAQRNLHNFEVVAEYAASLKAWLIAWRNWRTVFDQKVVIECVTTQGEFAYHCCVDTWKRVDSVEYLSAETSLWSDVFISSLRKFNSHGDQMIRIEP